MLLSSKRYFLQLNSKMFWQKSAFRLFKYKHFLFEKDKGCNDVVKKKLCVSSGRSALLCPVKQYSSTDIYWLVSSTSSLSGNLTHSDIH